MLIRPHPPAPAPRLQEFDARRDAGPSLADFPPPDAPNIPPLLHQVWLRDKRASGRKTGKGGQVPDGERAWAEAAQSLHPGWEYRLWTAKGLPRLWAADPFGLKAGYDRGLNPGFQSDLLRLLILWLHGGVYFDTDVQILRPLDGLCAGCDAFIGATFYPQVHERCLVENAVLGFSPRHPFLTQVLTRLAAESRDWPHRGGDFMDTVYLSGPGMLSAELLAWRASPAGMRSDVAVVPRRFLHGLSYEATKLPVDPGDYPDALAFHWLKGKWFLHDA